MILVDVMSRFGPSRADVASGGVAIGTPVDATSAPLLDSMNPTMTAMAGRGLGRGRGRGRGIGRGGRGRGFTHHVHDDDIVAHLLPPPPQVMPMCSRVHLSPLPHDCLPLATRMPP